MADLENRPHVMGTPPPREGEQDKICTTCGEVKDGPHKGDRIPAADMPQLTHSTHYKGAPISHGTCDDCGAAFVRQHKLERARKHPWWRKSGE